MSNTYQGLWQPSYDVDVHMDVSCVLTTLRPLSLTKLFEVTQKSVLLLTMFYQFWRRSGRGGASPVCATRKPKLGIWLSRWRNINPWPQFISTTMATITILSFLLPTLPPHGDDETTPIQLLLTPSSSSAHPFYWSFYRVEGRLKITTDEGMTRQRNQQSNSAQDRGEDIGNNNNVEKTIGGAERQG